LGRLLQRKYSTDGKLVRKTDYLIETEVMNGIMDAVYHSDGIVKKEGGIWQYDYYLKDHLTNVRTVFRDEDANGYISTSEIRQRNDYYAFGMEHKGSTLGSVNPSKANRYKYNGKEIVNEMDLSVYDYGARYYDPSIGRWGAVDPLASEYPGFSPYHFVYNNPIKHYDPTGAAPDDWYRNNKTGTYTWYDKPYANGSGPMREGYTWVGGKGALLGEAESHVNNIHPGGIYNDGFTIDVTSNNKGALLPVDGKGGGNFLDEFMNGKGPMVSVMMDDHPYTKSMQDAPSVNAAREFMGEGRNAVPGQLTNWEGAFNPITGPIRAGADIAEQFVGSFRLDVFSTKDQKNSIFIISDSKSRSSLFYHLPIENVPRASSSAMQNGMGNTFQYYIWKEKNSSGGGGSW
jgi:RHS repeat-associated protein